MRNINELIGIIHAVTYDDVINQREIDFLRSWVESNRNLAYEPKQAELIKLVDEVIEDNVVTEEERKQLLYACERLQKGMCKASDKIFELHGIVDGIISDGEVNEPEVRRLKNWMRYNKKYLAGCEEAEILDKKLDEILEDDIVTPEEQEELLSMLSETIEERKLETKLDYLRQKVRLRKNIGMDLIDMLNNEKHIARIHSLAEKQLRSAMISQSGSASDEAIIFVSLVLIAMLYYDGNFYGNAAKVYTSVYSKYSEQSVNGKLRGIINRYCIEKQRTNNTRTYVGNVLYNAIVPSNYLSSFFEFIYDIYKTNLHYTLQKNPYEDFKFVYDGLRRRLNEQAQSDVLTLRTQASTNKTYKLIKSTKDLILMDEKDEKSVDDVINLSIIVAKLIDRHIWNKELKIVNPYLKQGFEAWVKTANEKLGSKITREEFHSRWEPKLLLKGNQVELVPPVHRIPGDYEGQSVKIEISNGKEVLFTDNNPIIYNIIGGYEIRPKSVVLDKPLGKLVYKLKVDGYEKYRTGTKLHREFIVFSLDGKEIKSNTDYDGTIVICSNDDGLKYKADTVTANYHLTSKIIHCGDVITISNKLFSFSALEKPGISGEVLYKHYLVEIGKSKKILVYKSIKYLCFEVEKGASTFAIIINGQRKRLSDFQSHRIELQGKYKYIVQLNINEPGIYSFEVEQLEPTVIKVIKGIQVAVDPLLDFTSEQLSDTTYSVNVNSAFLSKPVYQNIEVNTFNMDWLKVNFNNKTYTYYLPFEFRFFRIKGKEWRYNRNSLWINELTSDSILEFIGDPDAFFVLSNTGEPKEQQQLLQKDNLTVEIPVGFLKTFKEEYEYVILVLTKNGKQYRGVYCNNKCNLDTSATEIDYDAANGVLYIAPVYYGNGKVNCRVFDLYNNEIFVGEIESGRQIAVKNIHPYTKYNICFFEKLKGLLAKKGKERLMATISKEFYPLSSLVGRQFKLLSAYYKKIMSSDAVEGTMKLQNTYIAIKSRYKDNHYIAELFISDTRGKRELKSINPVVIELCSNAIGDIVEIAIVKTKDNGKLFLDDTGIIDGVRRGATRVVNTFDMKLSGSSKFIKTGK